jgi:hypothetical protein
MGTLIDLELLNRWGACDYGLRAIAPLLDMGGGVILELDNAEEMAKLAGTNLLDLAGFLYGETRDEQYRVNLTGIDLSGRNLEGADLRGVNFTGANLSNANLTGANMKFAILKDALLVGATMDGANLYESDLTNADLTGASMRDTYLVGATIDGARFVEADLTDSRLFSEEHPPYAIDNFWELFRDVVGLSAVPYEMLSERAKENAARTLGNGYEEFGFLTDTIQETSDGWRDNLSKWLDIDVDEEVHWTYGDYYNSGAHAGAVINDPLDMLDRLPRMQELADWNIEEPSRWSDAAAEVAKEHAEAIGILRKMSYRPKLHIEFSTNGRNHTMRPDSEDFFSEVRYEIEQWFDDMQTKMMDTWLTSAGRNPAFRKVYDVMVGFDPSLSEEYREFAYTLQDYARHYEWYHAQRFWNGRLDADPAVNKKYAIWEKSTEFVSYLIDKNIDITWFMDRAQEMRDLYRQAEDKIEEIVRFAFEKESDRVEPLVEAFCDAIHDIYTDFMMLMGSNLEATYDYYFSEEFAEGESRDLGFLWSSDGEAIIARGVYPAQAEVSNE